MLVKLPRLTGSLRPHYDVDQAYHDRRAILQSLNTKKSNEESVLARRLVSGWKKASSDVRLAYREFSAAVVELVGSEVASAEFQEIAKTAYDLCSNLDMDSDAFNIYTDRKQLLVIEIQEARGYTYVDICEICPEKLTNHEAMIKSSYDEYLHAAI